KDAAHDRQVPWVRALRAGRDVLDQRGAGGCPVTPPELPPVLAVRGREQERAIQVGQLRRVGTVGPLDVAAATAAVALIPPGSPAPAAPTAPVGDGVIAGIDVLEEDGPVRRAVTDPQLGAAAAERIVPVGAGEEELVPDTRQPFGEDIPDQYGSVRGPVGLE